MNPRRLGWSSSGSGCRAAVVVRQPTSGEEVQHHWPVMQRKEQQESLAPLFFFPFLFLLPFLQHKMSINRAPCLHKVILVITISDNRREEIVNHAF